MDIVPQEGNASLSLKQLRETLELRGIGMSLSALSEFLKTEDIAELLQIGGGGNRLEIPPGVVEILSEFLPQYRAAKGRLPQAAGMLRSFLKQRTDGALVPVTEFRETEELRLLAEIRDALQQRAIPPPDALLTAQEAREAHGLPLPVFRTLRVKVGRRWYVKRSTVLRWLQSL